MTELPPEQQARQNIDKMLEDAGWVIQDLKRMNLGAALGVAIREFPVTSGFADYILFVNRKAVGVIEAKAEGWTLSLVAEQSGGYAENLPKDIPHVQLPLPFAYESTGVETRFRDQRDPDPRSRAVFSFHRPETFQQWLAETDTLRRRLTKLPKLPKLTKQGLRECQIEAVTNLEKSFAADRPRSLIQMATGSGKTFTAATFCYRLVKHAKAKRILFLVDRANLGRQTLKEFQQYVTPDDGRKFAELYNVQLLRSNTIDPVAKVCICTIQRLYSMLRGEPEFAEEFDEHSVFDSDLPEEQTKDVAYNPSIPIEQFDFIVTDECHRSIYNLWRQVLEYFDAYLIGLTATPSKQTLGFFNSNLVMEYAHERAVADGINVGYDVYRIKTKISEAGSKVEAGYFVDRRDRATRKVRWEKLDVPLEYADNELDRSVVSPSQIRKIITTFRDRLFTDIFPGRTEVPKTLVFAKDDSHAEDIVNIVREEFGKGNDFCKKITYRTTEDTDALLASLRNSYNPRIVVTVDMISTGVDVKPLECLLFMRDVKSQTYFEQMKGRGTRTISPTDLKAVTSDASAKTRFVIVDAVGVCESDKTETRPMERNPSVSFEKLLLAVAVGKRDDDNLSSLAGRLARLDREITDKDRQEIKQATSGKALPQLTNALLDALDPDKHIEAAKTIHHTREPDQKQVEQAREQLVNKACEPFDDPDFRNLLIAIKKRNEQTIDVVSIDELISAGYDEAAKERAKKVVASFEKFIKDHKDELTALQIIYSKAYKRRHLTYAAIRQLADALTKEWHTPSPDQVTAEVWTAYQQLEQAKVKGLSPQRLLTDIVSLVRFAVGQQVVLEPFADLVDERFQRWLESKTKTGKKFSDEQVRWLTEIKDHVASSLNIEMEDFDEVPFSQHGGRLKVFQLFGENLSSVLTELNEVLVA